MVLDVNRKSHSFILERG